MKLRLSEAIRLGAMLKPQARESLFDGVGTCALGAALDARGCELTDAFYDDMGEQIREWWPVLAMPSVGCKLGCYCVGWRDVLEDITHLNDFHKWTREEIADWVESIEQSLESQVSRVSSPVGEEQNV